MIQALYIRSTNEACSVSVFNQLLRIPSVYNTDEQRDHVRSVKIILLVVSVALVLLILENLISGDSIVVGILCVGLTVVIGVGVLTETGRVNTGIRILSLFLILMITLICTQGQGLRDIAVMGYPVVLVLSSLLQNKRDFILTFVVNLLCVAWLVAGVKQGWFHLDPPKDKAADDFIIVSIILIVTAFITKNLGNRLNRSLEVAESQNRSRMLKAAELDFRLQEKEDLLNGVHRVAMNGLTYLSELLKDERLATKNQQQIINKMELRTLAMSAAHQQLYERSSLTWVDVPAYFKLFTSKTQKLGMVQTAEWILHIDKGYLHIEQIIHLGVAVAEILYEMEDFENEPSILLGYDSHKDFRALTISSGRLTGDAILRLESNSLVDIMVRQLKGQLKVEPQLAKVSIQFNTAAK